MGKGAIAYSRLIEYVRASGLKLGLLTMGLEIPALLCGTGS